jgi:hypothetical protein
MRTRIHAYMHAEMLRLARSGCYIDTRTRIRTCADTNSTHVCAVRCTYMHGAHTCIHAYMHAGMLGIAHTYAHAHTRIHAYSDPQACIFIRARAYILTQASIHV